VTEPVNNGGTMCKPWGIAFGSKNGVWAVADNTECCDQIVEDTAW